MSSSFPIKIRDNNGDITTIMVTYNMEIKEIKELYQQMHSEAISEDLRTMELFFKGRTLLNYETIGELKIKPNNILSLLEINDNIEAGKF